MSEGDTPIHARVEGCVGRLTLNRPKALNALNAEMVRLLAAGLNEFSANPAVSLVLIDGAGERAFCAGGDLREVFEAGALADYDSPRAFWAEEYRLNAAIGAFPKPFVAFMDGIVMGGGVGVSAHGSHRVVTERSLLAMPECAIGLVPDVGGTHLLGRAPGRLGEFLGLTGWRMNASEAIEAGFADYLVPSSRLEPLLVALREAGDPAAIEAFGSHREAPRWVEWREEIDRIFAGESVAAILAALGDSRAPFAEEAARAIRASSPPSLAATLRLVRAARGDPGLRKALSREYRFTFRSQSEADFQEGIRAVVIDKDKRPRWRRPLEAFDEAQVEALIAPLGARELIWEERP